MHFAEPMSDLISSIASVPALGSSLFPPLLATTAESSNPIALQCSVLLSLIVIYLASKIGGEICIRLNLPPVLGELVGGVVVGISALHLLIFPEGGGDSAHSLISYFLQLTGVVSPDQAATVFATQSEVISLLSEIGVIILLFEIGIESDLNELLKVGPQALIVAVVGVAAPFTAGTIGLIWLFKIPVIAAVFAGAALTATSIGITAKVLSEIGQLSSREGQIIIGAAVIDDVLGIIVLAVVAGLGNTGEVEISKIIYLIVSAIVFMVGSILLGRWLTPFFINLVHALKTRGQLLITALIFAFVLSYIAAAIQLEAILGAFAAGLVLAETDKKEELGELIKPVADVLVPIFFVVVGARTDISVLNPFVAANREGLITAAFLIAVAIVGKVVTGLTVFGQPGINRLAIGFGMIPRGEVGLIFVSIGSTIGILSKSLEAAIIVMVILTTFLAPPLLRLVFPKEDTTPAVIASATEASK